MTRLSNRVHAMGPLVKSNMLTLAKLLEVETNRQTVKKLNFEIA